MKDNPPTDHPFVTLTSALASNDSKLLFFSEEGRTQRSPTQLRRQPQQSIEQPLPLKAPQLPNAENELAIYGVYRFF